jgi:hypothetical protein
MTNTAPVYENVPAEISIALIIEDAAQRAGMTVAYFRALMGERFTLAGPCLTHLSQTLYASVPPAGGVHLPRSGALMYDVLDQGEGGRATRTSPVPLSSMTPASAGTNHVLPRGAS